MPLPYRKELCRHLGRMVQPVHGCSGGRACFYACDLGAFGGRVRPGDECQRCTVGYEPDVPTVDEPAEDGGK